MKYKLFRDLTILNALLHSKKLYKFCYYIFHQPLIQVSAKKYLLNNKTSVELTGNVKYKSVSTFLLTDNCLYRNAHLQDFAFFSQCNLDFKDSADFDLTSFHQDHKTVIKLQGTEFNIIYLFTILCCRANNVELYTCALIVMTQEGNQNTDLDLCDEHKACSVLITMTQFCFSSSLFTPPHTVSSLPHIVVTKDDTVSTV